MSGALRMDGLQEFRDALRRLPEELSDEANDIVADVTSEAARTVQANYPTGPTGNLKRGVTREINRSKFGGSGMVRSRAKHAWIFEHGSKPRAYTTKRGIQHKTGRMPVAPAQEQFIPVAIRLRKKMTAQLVALVRRAGFQVEDAG